MHEYSGDDITVKWDAKKCFHSEVCVKNLPEVFDPKNKPWVNVKNSSSQSVMKTIDKCPSGALSYELNNEQSENKTDTITELKLMKNGPVRVKGKVVIIDSEGIESFKEGTFSLCRCGGSHNKTFCDGTHNKINFNS